MANRMRGKNNKGKYPNAFYNNSSVAYELQPAYYPEEHETRRTVKPNRHANGESLVERRSRVFHRIKLVAAITFVFGGCIITMSTYATVAGQRVKISNLKDELLLAQSENTTLQAEIADQVNLDFVEEQATSRLGMAEPQPYQIVYIDVPEQSYTVQYDVSSDKIEDGTFLDKISGMFKKD